jgi:RNA polymerase sigma factor (sigma-70 family)
LREDDREAVLATQRGEREAFDRLVERYQREVYRLCYRYVGNHQDANDMTQEAFLKAYRAIGRFRGDSAFSTWLYRIAVNTFLNFRSSRKPDAEEVSDVLPDRAPGALAVVERDERALVVRRAVMRLPKKQRATLILKIYHDLTHEEVAGVLAEGVPMMMNGMPRNGSDLSWRPGPFDQTHNLILVGSYKYKNWEFGTRFRLVSGGTDNHLMLIDLRNKNITGKEAEKALGLTDITVNKNMVPFDDKSAFVTSGIRIGVPAITTRGMKPEHMSFVVDLIDEALRNADQEALLKGIRLKVNDYMKQFPLYPELG